MNELPVNQIICGDALKVLKSMPSESVNCCISSPPYWALRDYGVDGQLGLEATFEEYIEKLATIYDEVKRVLRKDGTCFVNLGDTYGGSWQNYGNRNGKQRDKHTHSWNRKDNPKEQIPPSAYYKDKCLSLIPDRFRIAMVERGWIIRNKIVWHKPNPMPSSAKDRFTVDFEDVIFMVKSKKYFFEPQYEEYLKPLDRWGGDNLEANGQSTWDEGTGQNAYRDRNMRPNPLGRNKRCVWTIPTQPFPEAHFATYPEKLVEPMIEAGCPKYVCSKCGTPRKKVYETSNIIRKRKTDRTRPCEERGDSPNDYGGKELIDWHYSYCGCGADFVPGVVLDPFAGAATTLYVAAKLKRDYIGIELKQEYIDNIAMPRLLEAETAIPVKEQRQGQTALFDPASPKATPRQETIY